MPPVQPDVASLEALHAALGAVPPIPPRLLILDALTAAAAAVPDVALLSARWDQLNASLAALPPLPDAAGALAARRARRTPRRGRWAAATPRLQPPR
eukprot:470773-Prymnesium_polylepis.1